MFAERRLCVCLMHFCWFFCVSSCRFASICVYFPSCFSLFLLFASSDHFMSFVALCFLCVLVLWLFSAILNPFVFILLTVSICWHQPVWHEIFLCLLFCFFVVLSLCGHLWYRFRVLCSHFGFICVHFASGFCQSIFVYLCIHFGQAYICF